MCWIGQNTTAEWVSSVHIIMHSCEQFHSSASSPICVSDFTVQSSSSPICVSDFTQYVRSSSSYHRYFHNASVHLASVGNKDKLDVTRSPQFSGRALVAQDRSSAFDSGWLPAFQSSHIILSWLGLVKCSGETGERDTMYWCGAVHSCHLIPTLALTPAWCLSLEKWKNSLGNIYGMSYHHITMCTLLLPAWMTDYLCAIGLQFELFWGMQAGLLTIDCLLFALLWSTLADCCSYSSHIGWGKYWFISPVFIVHHSKKKKEYLFYVVNKVRVYTRKPHLCYQYSKIKAMFCQPYSGLVCKF